MYSDENPDSLHKQIGCMQGFFQMFDRNNFAVGRCINALNHKRITSGHAVLYDRKNESKGSAYPSKNFLDKNLTKSSNENPSVSVDSSRVSCSSISSSSFSSVDLYKSNNQDASFDRTFFRQKSSKSSDFDIKSTCSEVGSNTPIQSTQSRREVLDFRNAVKGSMLPLSIKTSTKEKAKNEKVKHVDSPRPAVLPKTSEGAQAQTKASPYLSPRFSCDGRELSRQPVDSQSNNSKPIDKIGQMSRLSLDSRDGSPSISNFYSRANSLLDDTDRQRRSPSVVVRLMGLDELPSTPSTPKVSDTKYDQLSYSPKSNSGDPLVQKQRYRSSPSRNVSAESAPWLQQNEDCIAQNAERNASVYGEIQKRLQQLELHHSDKDLRDLKQLLCAMKSKDAAKRNGASEKQSESSAKDQSERQDHRSKRSFDSLKNMMKRNGTSNAVGSPIVIMKPAKSLNKIVGSVNTLEGLLGLPKLRTNSTDDGIEVSKSKGYSNYQSPKLGNREQDVFLLLSTDKRYSKQYREDNLQKSHSNQVQSLYKPQDSPSPRGQSQKLEAEKRSYASTPSVANKVQTQNKNRSLDERSSSTSKVRTKRSHVLKDEGEACDVFSSRTSLALTSDAEMDSKRTSIQKKLFFLHHCIQTPSKQNFEQSENETETMELANISAVLHSPVSVLDASLFQDASEHSPAKETSDNVQDDSTQSSVDSEPLSSSEVLLSKLNADTKLKNRDNAEADNQPHTNNCNNPDHKYVSEILAATGLLSKDKQSRFTFSNPFKQAINPDMFYVLEQSKYDWSSILESTNEHTAPKTKLSPQELHRKLVFDVVNELLTDRIELVTYSSPSHLLLQIRKQSGELLLHQLCSEIEKLEAKGIGIPSSDDYDDNCTSAEDVAYQSGWEFDRERAKLALAIEKLVLRDLVDETINGLNFSVF